ncbi:MAG: UDP-N-acetylmuramoyl-L-alanine--D-glutamate ligase [bacterium]|nr:UDP-N-acetylmuramoyl-L-alanine--D-glutamate ligase [bacterium]
MKIAILGWGIEGKSAYKHYLSPENEIHVLDYLEQTDVPDGVPVVFGPEYLYDLDEYDLIVRSPGIHPSLMLKNNEEHAEILSKTTTATNEFFEQCKAPNIIGVTGTKGKGTTSTLITKILEAAGHKVHLGGNIGLSPLDMLKNDDGSAKIGADDWVVLELANFQLIDLKHSPKIGVCLMVTEEHLDWHKDMYEYIQAKQNMFQQQQHDDLAVYNVRSSYSEEIVGVSHARKTLYDVPPIDADTLDDRGVHVSGNDIIAYDTKVCSIEDVALLGRHNLENVCAAIAATWHIIKHDTELITKVVRDFPGLPNRLEILGQIDGVWFINDSFGTTPDTAIVAIDTFEKNKVLILGGSDKGADYSRLVRKILENQNEIRHIVAIGTTGPKIVASLQKMDCKIPITEMKISNTMTQIVNAAKAGAKKGDVVVLSTGSASFDMFSNYKERGDQFTKAVQALA